MFPQRPPPHAHCPPPAAALLLSVSTGVILLCFRRQFVAFLFPSVLDAVCCTITVIRGQSALEEVCLWAVTSADEGRRGGGLSPCCLAHVRTKVLPICPSCPPVQTHKSSTCSAKRCSVTRPLSVGGVGPPRPSTTVLSPAGQVPLPLRHGSVRTGSISFPMSRATVFIFSVRGLAVFGNYLTGPQSGRSTDGPGQAASSARLRGGRKNVS